MKALALCVALIMDLVGWLMYGMTAWIAIPMLLVCGYLLWGEFCWYRSKIGTAMDRLRRARSRTGISRKEQARRIDLGMEHLGRRADYASTAGMKEYYIDRGGRLYDLHRNVYGKPYGLSNDWYLRGKRK